MCTTLYKSATSLKGILCELVLGKVQVVFFASIMNDKEGGRDPQQLRHCTNWIRYSTSAPRVEFKPKHQSKALTPHLLSYINVNLSKSGPLANIHIAHKLLHA